jgi:chloramphenicol 3-O-phosphotransferase
VTLGKIILLNGTLSSGKSSIVSALQDILEEPFLNAGIDKFIWMLPWRYLKRPLWDAVLRLATEAGAVGQWLMSGMHQTMKSSAEACALLIKQRLKDKRPPDAFKRLKQRGVGYDNNSRS